MSDLRDAVVELGRAAIARLADTERSGGEVVGRIRALADAWDANDVAQPAGPAARLGRLCDRPEEQILLALAAAPALDDGLASAYRAASSREDGAVTLGLLLTLATHEKEARRVLAGTFDGERALRQRYLIRCDGDPANEDFLLTVPPPVARAFAGEAPPAPDGSAVIEPVEPPLPAALVEGLGLWELRPRLTVLTGPMAAQRAIADILASAGSAPMWHIAGTKHHWGELLRDSALAGAVVVLDLGGADADVVRAIDAVAEQIAYPVIGLDGPARGSEGASGLARIDVPASLDAARVRRVREALRDPAAPERMRQGVEHIVAAL